MDNFVGSIAGFVQVCLEIQSNTVSASDATYQSTEWEHVGFGIMGTVPPSGVPVVVPARYFQPISRKYQTVFSLGISKTQATDQLVYCKLVGFVVNGDIEF